MVAWTPERARQLLTDFEQVTIRDLANDLRRAVDLRLELGIYAFDAYILEVIWVSGTRARRSDPEEREQARLVLGGAGPMKL